MTRYFPFLRVLLALPAIAVPATVHAIEQSPNAATPIVIIDGLGKGTVSLSSPWQFHIGDNPAWALPEANDTTGENGWEQISSDSSWGEQGHAGYTGFAWYRQHVRLTPAPGTSSDFALLMGWVDDAYEIYWNGQLVGKGGRMPPQPSRPYEQPDKTFGLGAARDGVLAIRVWKGALVSNEADTGGGLFLSPVIGSPAAIAARKALSDFDWIRRRQYQFGLLLIYGLIVVLGLLAWMRDRSQRPLFWMIIFCAAEVLTSLPAALRMTISYYVVGAAGTVLYALHDVAVWFLLLYLFNLDRHRGWVRFTRILAIFAMVNASADGLIALSWNNPIIASRAIQMADATFTGIGSFLELYALVLVIYAFRTKLDLARNLVAIAAFCAEMITVLAIVASQGSRYTHWTLGYKLEEPLFVILGNEFDARLISESLLLLTIIYAVYVYQRESSQRQKLLEQEFRSARELQQILIPETLPAIPGFAISSAYKPAQEVGGDFFQIIYDGEGEKGSALIVLGDVSGKGLKAAMAVSLIVGTVRTLAESTTSPAMILAGLNRRLHGRLGGGFATCCVLLLHSNSRCVAASAGHPSPLINGEEISIPPALPLGISPSASYEEVEIALHEGDHLALYTDGLLEARNKTGELYSFDRVSALFAARPTAAEASDAAVAFGQDDDITVLVLTRLAVGEESVTELTAPQASPAHA